jgi:hypothetical protein
MVHDVSRALMWLFTFSINIAQKNLEIPTRYNSIYTQKDVLRALTFLSLEREYAEGGLKRLTKRLRRANQPKKTFKKSRRPATKPKKPKAPDSDTLLLRLKQISRPKTKSMLCNLNRQVLAAAKTKGAFRKKVVVAIDLTSFPTTEK